MSWARDFPSLPRAIWIPFWNVPDGIKFLLCMCSLRFPIPWSWASGGSPMIESSHTLICFPFLGIHVILAEKKGRAFKRIGRMAEPFLTLVEFSRHLRRLLEKYFFQRAALHYVNLTEIIFHIIFSPSSTFCKSSCLICNPPYIKGFTTFPQLTRESFFSFFFPPFQRKFWSKDSILARTPFGASKMEHW